MLFIMGRYSGAQSLGGPTVVFAWTVFSLRFTLNVKLHFISSEQVAAFPLEGKKLGEAKSPLIFNIVEIFLQTLMSSLQEQRIGRRELGKRWERPVCFLKQRMVDTLVWRELPGQQWVYCIASCSSDWCIFCRASATASSDLGNVWGFSGFWFNLLFQISHIGAGPGLHIQM